MLARPTPETASPALQPLYARIASVGVEIEGLPPDMWQRFCDLLRPFVAACPEKHPDVRFEVRRVPKHSGWIIVQNGEVIRSIQDPEKLLGYLEWCAVAHALETTSLHAVFHAAALTRGGATLVLVAESGSGKTTLTTSLIQRGWLPLADDISLVNLSTTEVQPFPRCFHADDFTASTISTPSLFEQPGSLAGYIRPLQWATTPSRPTYIVRLQRDTQVASTAHQITQAEAAGTLLAASIGNAPSRSTAARTAAAMVAGAQSCWQLNNNQLSDAIDLLEHIAAVESGGDSD